MPSNGTPKVKISTACMTPAQLLAAIQPPLPRKPRPSSKTRCERCGKNVPTKKLEEHQQKYGCRRHVFVKTVITPIAADEKYSHEPGLYTEMCNAIGVPVTIGLGGRDDQLTPLPYGPTWLVRLVRVLWCIDSRRGMNRTQKATLFMDFVMIAEAALKNPQIQDAILVEISLITNNEEYFYDHKKAELLRRTFRKFGSELILESTNPSE